MHAIILAAFVSMLGCANGGLGGWNRKPVAESTDASTNASTDRDSGLRTSAID